MRRSFAFVLAAVFPLIHCGDSAPPGGEAPDASLDASAPDTSPPFDGGDAASDASAPIDASAPSDASASDAAPPETKWHDRSDKALQRMLLTYFSGADQYLRAAPAGTALTGYWTNVQGLDALLDGIERTGGEHYAGLLETFYVGQTEHGGVARDFYDDENWMALALLRAFDLTHDAKYLTTAKSLYADIMAGWDTTCCGATKGGVWWDRPHTQKATAANAGAVITGVRLAERAKDASYATFAKQVYAYWSANMVDPSTHQVIDHVTLDGTKVAWKFTYNEGLMIAAALELARTTGDASYGATADAVADFAIHHEVAASANVLSDGTNAGCAGDCAQFKGIGFRYLTMLAKARPANAALRALLDASAASIWDHAGDPATTLFAIDWLGPTMDAPPVEADSSAAMALAAYASLVEPVYVSDGSRKAGVYEAEDATLHHVGLEAMHAGYSGWGYVAGWGSDGQSVTFHVNVPTAKTYDVTFAYSAFSGATRAVKVGANVVVAKQAFTSTGSWDSATTTNVSLPLAAGDNDVSIVFDAAGGSAGFLNLDRIVVAP